MVGEDGGEWKYIGYQGTVEEGYTFSDIEDFCLSNIIQRKKLPNKNKENVIDQPKNM